MRLNKKVLVILFIFFGIVFLFGNRSFAYDENNFELIDYDITFTDLQNNEFHLTQILRPKDTLFDKFFIFFNNDNQCYFYWFSGVPVFTIVRSDLSPLGTLKCSNANCLSISYEFYNNSPHWYPSSIRSGNCVIGELNRPDCGYNDIFIKASTFDIVVDDNVVFQAPVARMGLIPLEVIKPTQVQVEMRRILPILVVVGVGILATLVVIPIVIKKIVHF